MTTISVTHENTGNTYAVDAVAQLQLRILIPPGKAPSTLVPLRGE